MSGDESDGDTRVLAASPRERLLGGAVVARRYEVRGVLGVGGMGSVYDVFDRNLEERVALKILQAGERADATLVERFRREVRLARRISHRNTARVYDIGVDGERWYLTMELIDGESLQALLERESRLPITRACAIMADVCAGLAAIHAAGVVHRDLKPGNVLLERGGRVAITDFGIARKIKRGADDPLMTCGMIGTPLYMAPEQAVGSPEVDARADIYAVGVMLYE
ncbi:MAG: serine/threonine protein kinase, partial [Myxococcales bacterium]|nr:serine/threonine protein kinase [Myxococcales bacterium]